MNFLFSPCSASRSDKKRTQRDLEAAEPSHTTWERGRRWNKSRVARLNSTLGQTK